VLVLDMIEILPPLGKYKYDTWRILPVKCYIDNSVRLRSCIRNVNKGYWHMGPFSLGDGTFNNDMVDMAIIISVLPFGFEVCV
jgi:hypothetical protein